MTNKWQKLSEESTESDTSPEADQMEAEFNETPELEFPDRALLENKLTELENKVGEYKDQMLRTQAEMDNLRRRTERDVTNSIKFGNEKILLDLLPVADSLVRALESGHIDNNDPKSKALYEGIQLTLELLSKTLEKHGVKTIAPKRGDDFNPQLHEAMTMQEVPDAKSNTILQVFQLGYELHGRVIRAARVVVAK